MGSKFKPNVLMVCFDHWPASLFGVAGNKQIHTPTLDTLANAGTRFTNAYSECPVCIPARRTMMTGTTPKTHGDRIYSDRMEMPDVPTLANTFRNAGYQTSAVGKLHVYPQRNRIGFEEVLLAEEGRTQFGAMDDYEVFLSDQGHSGELFFHGMGNNEYVSRPWHLEENLHGTNWTTHQMARTIQRRDPTRPGFWYLSYTHPHPPLAPLRDYLAMYDKQSLDLPWISSWAKVEEGLKRLPASLRFKMENQPEWFIREALHSFYALCTHIDHQLRIVLGTLREEKQLSNTYILVTSDHGDMLGKNHLWGKRLFYEESANIPMFLIPPYGSGKVKNNHIDNRLVGLQDIMPTLCDLCDIPLPDSVEGVSMLGNKRDYLYGEIGENHWATRMIHDGKHKLIYYPSGNCRQLFDLEKDPEENNDLSNQAAYRDILLNLENKLLENLYNNDQKWIEGGKLVGIKDQPINPVFDPGLHGQRGSHLPVPPQSL